MLVGKAKHGLSKYVRELYGNGTLRKYYINDLLLYYERGPIIVRSVQLIILTKGTTPVYISNVRIEVGR